jgi:hypothetical protein
MPTTPATSTGPAERSDQHAEARAAQRYRLYPDACRNCRHLEYDVKHVSGARPWDQYESTPVQTNLHCGIGRFPVRLSAVCDRHQSPK